MKTKRTAKIVLNIIAVLLVISALCFLGFSILCASTNPRPVFGYYIFTVVTSSMEPDIKTDSIIIVKKTDPEEIYTGDIISFESDDPGVNGAIITHRVVSVEYNSDKSIGSFVTKGDANMRNDAYKASPQKLYGRVVYKSFKLGSIYKTISTNRLLSFSITILPLFIIVVIAFVDVVLISEKSKESFSADIDKNENEKK